MPRDAGKAPKPLRWLENARGDLAMARAPLPPGACYEHLCFHAQQAAEKSIKAVLLQCGVEFPFTHELQSLVDMLPPDLSAVPALAEAANLNLYAVATRYADEMEPVSEDEYWEALRIAEAVTTWAESVILRSR